MGENISLAQRARETMVPRATEATHTMKDHHVNPPTGGVSDTELMMLFHQESERAWKIFIDRYADHILSELHRLGFDYDQAMDRFVYVCEKLCENGFRRLKAIRYAGTYGELIPWVQQVVKRLCINWAWSADGRKRLYKPIAQLPARERHIFELYFWEGRSPSEIYEVLRCDHQSEIDLIGVLDALERIFSRLSQKKLWRLMSNLVRRRGAISLDEMGEKAGSGFEPADHRPDPERALIQKEIAESLNRALDALPPRERLVIQFRYEEGLAAKEIAELLHEPERAVKQRLKAAMKTLRRALK